MSSLHVYTWTSSTVWKNVYELLSCANRDIKHSVEAYLSAPFMWTQEHQAHSVEAYLSAPSLCTQWHQADYDRQTILVRDKSCRESIILAAAKCFLSSFMGESSTIWQDVSRTNLRTVFHWVFANIRWRKEKSWLEVLGFKETQKRD